MYRQEKHLQSLGVCLSRQTMSNWTIACADKLDFIYDKQSN
ncbi:IS66 family transposase [Intestinibacter bartlettii]|uniref:IS66 family transposase n=1 Tax=Intestinibacter bartlettii TaxID=261299 RepID=A0ABS8CWE2_9FIRM|nr:IS66 family transposase [Intestinibacter bartlettii]MCB5403509.1 IS66 family transposase [Intestinibacter bartlettii]MCB5445766.1 IS66 family transposase [Intestinibacter bartlettii]MCB5719429.1 IS66 family transposase [Intestinibacter bartlettii]MCB5748352.1 IS66 family transposase [Intestinibacter bartlettii]